jgi:signal transduction histidine kinase
MSTVAPPHPALSPLRTNLILQTVVALGFLAGVVVVAVIAVTFTFRTVQELLVKMDYQHDVTYGLLEMNLSLLQGKTAVDKYAENPEDQRKSYEENRVRSDKAYQDIITLYIQSVPEGEQKEIRELPALRKPVDEAAIALFATKDSLKAATGDERTRLQAEETRQFKAFADASAKLEDSLKDLIEEIREEAVEAVEADLTTQINNAVIAGLVIVLPVVLLSFLGTTTILRRNVREVVNITHAAEKYVDGKYETRIETPLQNEVGRLGGTLNVLADRVQEREKSLKVSLAEAQEARDKAEKAERAKTAFLANMSHELRTPLNSVINFSKFVSRGMMGEVNEEQAEALGSVIDSGEHLLDLVNDLLDISKIEAGALVLMVKDDVDMTPLLAQAVTTAQNLLHGRSITLNTNIPETLPTVRGDHKRLLQILLNLVSNACKYTSTGSVTLSAKSEGAGIQIVVKDTGVGMPDSELSELFVPFRQGEAGIRQGTGTGLGLPITKRLIEAHDGKLIVESVVGIGTTFTVWLPLKAESLKALVG